MGASGEEAVPAENYVRHMWSGPAGKCFFQTPHLRERCSHMFGLFCAV
jgi:hypothetical protein